jgi:hypothetical protein
MGLQVTADTFLLIAGNTLELYRLNTFRNEFTTEKIFRAADLKHLYPQSNDPWWIRCRLTNESQLYCLDNINGLFTFDSNLENCSLVSSRSSCFDFLLTDYHDRIFQCMNHG